MTTQMFSTERWRRYRPSEDEGSFLVGNAERFEGLYKNATRLAWGKPIPEAERARVRLLHLDPTPRQAKTFELPEYVPELVNLQYLAIPFPYVPRLDPERLPATLHSLQVHYEAERFGPVEASSVRWPDISLPFLEGLFFTGLGPARWRHLGVGREHVPRLESLKANLGEDEEVLPALERMGQIEAGEFYHAGNIDLFGCLPNTIQDLYLNSTKSKFDGSKIARLHALRSLMLVGMYSPFDLAWLEGLPYFIELQMYEVKKMQHIESILALKKLRRLVVVDCRKPFSKELQAKLAKVGYDELDVRFA